MIESDKIKNRCTSPISERMTLGEYFDKCKELGKEMYLSPSERLLKAIGEPKIVDTSTDSKLRAIFGPTLLRQYEVFKDFYGMEKVIEQIVDFFKYHSQGLEESKQILYLLGPVGSAKSSLVTKLKQLMEVEPFFYIDGSPIFDNPLSLLSLQDAEELGIPEHYLNNIPSPWLVKRVQECKDPLNELYVVKRHPNLLQSVAMATTIPGDENTQDVSTMTGKTKLSGLAEFSQNDPDCYEFSGSLNRANRGMMEFVEMFKAPIKTIHPLLTATQEHFYNGTENIGAIPFEGIIIAHSNEPEWNKFVSNKDNEAFLDRIRIVRVMYNLRVDEEIKIYEKIIRSSALRNSKVAPYTLESAAKLAIMTRLNMPQSSSIITKMKVYNGEDMRNNPRARTYFSFKDEVEKSSDGNLEGMKGISTRDIYKILSKVFNEFDDNSANPITLFKYLDTYIRELNDHSLREQYTQFMAEGVIDEYKVKLADDLHNAYLKGADDLLQSKFENYILAIDMHQQEQEYRDPMTGQLVDREDLNAKMEEIEKAAGIGDPKVFRREMLDFVLRARASSRNVRWNTDKRMADVMKKTLTTNMAEFIGLIDTKGKASKDDKKKYDEFIQNLVDQGYPEKSVPLVIAWYTQRRTS